ncbi:MAG: hypothetical protein Q7S74_04835 [Nanoarchaeota archaeon]|nr:hypothetical protein [Nanoarchaeota archaeon]
MNNQIYYPEIILKTWRTGRLGGMYMSHFTDNPENPQIKAQLEIIVNALKNKKFKERLAVFKKINQHLDYNVREEYYENAARLKRMVDYCRLRILD